jgi:hypothetical protein
MHTLFSYRDIEVFFGHYLYAEYSMRIVLFWYWYLQYCMCMLQYVDRRKTSQFLTAYSHRGTYSSSAKAVGFSYVLYAENREALDEQLL